MSIVATVLHADTLDWQATPKTNTVNDVASWFPFPPWGFLIISAMGSYLIGKAVEFSINTKLGYGFRAVPFEKEICTILIVCHELTIISDNLGTFVDHNDRTLNRFVKFLHRRRALGGTFLPVVIVHREDDSGDVKALDIMKQRLAKEKLSTAVKFVKWKSEYPSEAYFGLRKRTVKAGVNWFRPRYWVRYKQSPFHSGVVSSRPFFPSTSQEQYEVISRLYKNQTENK